MRQIAPLYLSEKNVLYTEPKQDPQEYLLTQMTPTFSDSARDLEGAFTERVQRPTKARLGQYLEKNRSEHSMSPFRFAKIEGVFQKLEKYDSEAKMWRDIHAKLKHSLKHTYKIPQKAFSEFDFEGVGFISVDHFLRQHSVKKIGYPIRDIKEWLLIQLRRLNSQNTQHINFNSFKTLFFPSEGLVSRNNSPHFTSRGHRSEGIRKSASFKDAESRIKEKIAKKFSTVRKAFLSLDYNYDGYIVAEDIIRLFINDNEHISYHEVNRIFKRKELQSTGKLDFAQFCSWVGTNIEPNYGVFQPSLHTIEANNIPPPPPPLKQMKNQAPFMRNSHSNILRAYHTQHVPVEKKKSIKQVFSQKLKAHFTSIKKAFFSLCDHNSGLITTKTLKECLRGWSLQLSEQEKGQLYNLMDSNQDGRIDFDDFQVCFGNQIVPKESLYFRQEYGKKEKPPKCTYEGCWDQVSHSSRRFCLFHSAWAQRKAETMLRSFSQQIGSNWGKLQAALENEMAQKERSQSPKKKRESLKKLIEKDQFFKIMSQFGLALPELEKSSILERCEEKEHSFQNKVNLNCVFAIVSRKKENEEASESDEQAISTFGANLENDRNIHIQKNIGIQTLTMEELYGIIKRENHLALINSRLKKLDGENSGLATLQEIKRLFCDSYPSLEQKDFKQLLKGYRHQHNHLLVVYPRFISALRQSLNCAQVKPLRRSSGILVKDYLTPSKGSMELDTEDFKLTSSTIDKILELQNTSASKPIEIKRRNSEISRNIIRRQSLSPLGREESSPNPTAYVYPAFRKFMKNGQLPKKKLSFPIEGKFHQRTRSAIGLEQGSSRSLIAQPSATYLREGQDVVSKEIKEKTKRIRAKVIPEWKTISYQIKQIDLLGNGIISKEELQRIIQKCGIYIDREEWRLIFTGCILGGQDQDAEKIEVSKFIDFLGLPRQEALRLKSAKYMQKLQALKNQPLENPIKKKLRLGNIRNYEEENGAKTERQDRSNERMTREGEAQALRRKILLNWRNIYDEFKNKNPRSNFISLESFHKVLNNFGIYVSADQLGEFSLGSSIKYRDFLSFHIGSDRLEKSVERG